MIPTVLTLIKQSLNDHIQALQPNDEIAEDAVVFIDGQNTESVTFRLGAVSCLLVNIEEETMMRAPNPYQASTIPATQASPRDRNHYDTNPAVFLNLHILFVARFKEYSDSLGYLSRVIDYFQKHRVFTKETTLALSESGIEKIVVELVTLPFSQQNDVWSALRTAYQPSVLYKIKMVYYQDQLTDPQPRIGDRADDIQVELTQGAEHKSRSSF